LAEERKICLNANPHPFQKTNLTFAGGGKILDALDSIQILWYFSNTQKSTTSWGGTIGGGYSRDITCSKPIPQASLNAASPALPLQTLGWSDERHQASWISCF